MNETKFIKGLLVECGKEPVEINIPTDETQLSFLQNKVQGYIEIIGLKSYDNDTNLEVDLICNDEGKMRQLDLNRFITVNDIVPSGSNEIHDVIAGNFIIVQGGVYDGEFKSLSDKNLNE